LESKGIDVTFLLRMFCIVFRMRFLDAYELRSLGMLEILREDSSRTQLRVKVRTTSSPYSLRLLAGVGLVNLSLGLM
jgi:hypothetical protein